MTDIPEGYVLVPQAAYDLLIQAAMPPRLMIDPTKIDPGKFDQTRRFGEPQVTCDTREAE
jgi:hypothetical protein